VAFGLFVATGVDWLPLEAVLLGIPFDTAAEGLLFP
jgi:hypothetical protein